MDKIHVHARLTIKDGKLEAFKSIAQKAVAIVRGKDTGTQMPRLRNVHDRDFGGGSPPMKERHALE